jgi:hypothetical protein
VRIKLVTRRSLARLLVLGFVLLGAAVLAYVAMIRMPGQSYAGPLPKLTEVQHMLAARLRNDVDRIAGPGLGERNLETPEKLDQTVRWITQSLIDMGYVVNHQQFLVERQTVINVEVERPGTTKADEIIVVGAHFDTAELCPGANDNGSGVAATLALAQRFSTLHPERTLRFVFFANEEPPYFQTDSMGSVVYANACRGMGDDIVAMFSLETIGCYVDEPGSQKYPPGVNWLYPSTGNFIAFVGNIGSRELVRDTVGSFRELAQFPSEGGALPGWMTGVGWSDHWAFWQAGYPALMVTDTAPFRYPHYHLASDTPDKLDYERMARVVDGVGLVVERLANPEI